MIHFRVAELCRERGITEPVATLMKIGISQGIVSKYLNGKAKRIPQDHIEKLCLLFRCTPNELFCWTPDSKNDDYPEHPLQTIRCKPAFNLKAILEKMPLEELRKRFEKE